MKLEGFCSSPGPGYMPSKLWVSSVIIMCTALPLCKLAHLCHCKKLYVGMYICLHHNKQDYSTLLKWRLLNTSIELTAIFIHSHYSFVW